MNMDLEETKRLAKRGDAAAQTRLGLAYKWGEAGLKVDDRKAVAWFRKAAEQGDPNGQAQLGAMYDAGRGLSKDKTQASAWCGEAAKELSVLAGKGDLLALFNLGWMRRDGLGVPQDDIEAVACYRKAAEQGYAAAQTALGSMYDEGRGVPQDDKEAVAWFRKAAEQGNAFGQANLGLMYFNGRGVPQDDKEAAAWFRKAAEQGNADAQYALGEMYANGRGVPQNDREAAAWFRKAAEQGDAAAQYALGLMYDEGRGVPQDDKEAAAWFLKAADQGHADAQKMLGHMYAEGRDAPQDREKAVDLFRKAAEQGDAVAMYNMGVESLLNGAPFFGRMDALKWFGKAAAQDGDPDVRERARQALERLTKSSKPSVGSYVKVIIVQFVLGCFLVEICGPLTELGPLALLIFAANFFLFPFVWYGLRDYFAEVRAEARALAESDRGLSYWEDTPYGKRLLPAYSGGCASLLYFFGTAGFFWVFSCLQGPIIIRIYKWRERQARFATSDPARFDEACRAEIKLLLLMGMVPIAVWLLGWLFFREG